MQVQFGIPVVKLFRTNWKMCRVERLGFVTGNYNFETGSMTKILEQLKWESLNQRRKGNRLILLYLGLKGQASIPVDDLKTPFRHTRNHHSKTISSPICQD